MEYMKNEEVKCGLHNHVKEQGNKQNFLQECIEQNANIISITDHRTLISYYNLFSGLTKEQREQYKDLRFVLGMELTGMLDYETVTNKVRSIPVDILAYNIDISSYEKLYQFIETAYSNVDYMDGAEYQKKELEQLITIAKGLGYKADYDAMQISETNPFSSRVLSYGLIDPKYVEYNLQNGLLPELLKNPRGFKNREIKDPEGAFYIDLSKFYPNASDVINKIHESNSLAFIPHSAAYFAKADDAERRKIAWENSYKFAHDFVSDYPVDGIEIVHPSYMDNKEYYCYLMELARKNKLMVSGGTDYHKSGEAITKDFMGNYITTETLYNVNDWAKLYTIDEVIELGRAIAEIEKGKVAQKKL